MSAQSYCPVGVATGIVTLKGPVSPDTAMTIMVNNPPFTFAPAPRNTPPTMIGNKIEDSYENTVIYKSNKYGMAHVVQICAPMHTGYPSRSGALPVAELIIAFSNTKLTGSFPSGILLCVPIYESSAESHVAYINQLINSTAPVASLQTIFFENKNDNTQYSMGYQTCIEVAGGSAPTYTITNYNLFVLVFSEGIKISSKSFQSLVSKITGGPGGKLPQFQLPPALRDGSPTVSAYTFDNNGNKIQTAVSQEGYLYTTQVSTGTDDFSNRFEIFPPPKLSSSSNTMFNESCPYYKSTQYKCVPFDRIQNMAGKYVIPEGTQLSKIISGQNKTMSADMSSSGGISTSTIETAVAAVGGIILAGAFALIIGHYVVKLSED